MQASYEEKETGHRVIVGREYYEPFGLEPQEVVGRAITHLIRKKVPRQTEGARLFSFLCSACMGMGEVEPLEHDWQPLHHTSLCPSLPRAANAL